MVSIPSPQPQIQEQQLRKRIAILEAEVRRLKPFEQQVIFENTLFANPHISPTHRLTLRECLFGKQKVSVDALSKVYIPAIAEKIGLSAKTTGKSLKFLALTGAIRRETETKTNENGEHVTRVFLGLTEQIYHPETIKPPTKRNHGGKRYCKDCGSDNLIEQKTITCMDCGAEQHKSRRLINPKAKTTDTQLDPRYTDNQHIDHIDHDVDHSGIDIVRSNNIDTITITLPMDNLTPLKTKKEPADNLTPGSEKPPTPPVEAVASPVTLPAILPLPTCLPDRQAGRQAMQAMKERPQSAMPTCLPAYRTGRPDRQAGRQAEQETERDLDQETAQLLLDIAGDTQEHIVMNSNPHNPMPTCLPDRQAGRQAKKYLTVHRSLNLEDIQQHLKGTKTVGAPLTHNDGTTRALCSDGDDDRVWQALTKAANLLEAQGYRPLLEPSPAGRGGHLWIIFTERVHAQAAYTQACTIAPMLNDIAEYWPKGNGYKVRLPAGKYVTSDFAQWCHLYDPTGKEISNLILHLTPADLIPNVPVQVDHVPAQSLPADPKRIRDERSITRVEHGGVDEYHRRKYGKHEMWVEWPSEQYLIDRFNEQHTIDDLAARERNGMINASTIGRPERTASVGVTKDGEHFTDFGAGARKADGSQDGGDAFEFYIRLHNLNKSDVLREFGQALNREASQELLRSARAGELPSADVMKIITPTGREVYNQNATRHGHKTLEEHNRGVDGFSDVEKDEKQGVRLPWQVEQDHEPCLSAGRQGIPEDFTTGTPCEHCGCALYRDMLGSCVCVRCYPPRGYHNYSDLIDDQYPRVKRFRL